MLAKHLLSNPFNPLKTSDTGLFALNLMDEFKIAHLPIVNNKTFLGLLSETDIYNSNNPDEPIGNHKLSIIRPFVNDSQHIFEAIKIYNSLEITTLPVLNDKEHYLGLITNEQLVKSFSEIISIDNPGGIIILELNDNDYSLSEISQIIESNDAKVLSLFLNSHENSTKLDVIIKVNKMDIAPIMQTFNRYNYIIKASFSEQNRSDDMQNRYDAFMNFLNI